MKIKNLHLYGVLELLQNMKINSVKDSRLRHRFMRKIADHLNNTYEKERQETIRHFAQIDLDGNVKSDENGRVLFKDNGEQGCVNELQILDNDFLIIDMNEQNKEMLLTISRLVFDDNVIPILSGAVSVAHDILCDEAEKVEDYYNSQDKSN